MNSDTIMHDNKPIPPHFTVYTSLARDSKEIIEMVQLAHQYCLSKGEEFVQHKAKAV